MKQTDKIESSIQLIETVMAVIKLNKEMKEEVYMACLLIDLFKEITLRKIETEKYLCWSEFVDYVIL